MAANAGYGDTTAFWQGLSDRGIGYVVAIKGPTTAYRGDAESQTLPYVGRGRPATLRYRDPHLSCRDLAVAAGRAAGKTVTWRQGTRTDPDNPTAAMLPIPDIADPSRQPRHHPADDGSLPQAWLLVEWPTGAHEPTDY